MMILQGNRHIASSKSTSNTTRLSSFPGGCRLKALLQFSTGYQVPSPGEILSNKVKMIIVQSSLSKILRNFSEFLKNGENETRLIEIIWCHGLKSFAVMEQDWNSWTVKMQLIVIFYGWYLPQNLFWDNCCDARVKQQPRRGWHQVAVTCESCIISRFY